MRRHGNGRRFLVVALTAAVAAPATAQAPPLLADGSTTRLSTRVDGTQATDPAPGSGVVSQPSISANGRYAVFYTTLALGLGRCGPGTYLRDLVTGRLEMVSVPARGCGRQGVAGSSHSYTSISANGRFVVFASYARDLLPGRLLPERSPTGMHTPSQVFLRDRLRKRTVLVSVGYDGRPANGGADRPTVSDDGRYVAFASPATNLVRGDSGDPDDSSRTDVFVRDLARGVTERAGADIRRQGRGAKLFPSISGNGRFVVFDADDGYLAPHRGTGNSAPLPQDVLAQTYVWDRRTRKTELVSRSTAGYAAFGIATFGGYVGSKISRDGRWIVYASNARNLTGPTGTGLYDHYHIYLYDRVRRITTRVSNGLHGEGGNAESRHPCISADGRFVSFASAASNLGDVDLTPSATREELAPVGTDIYLYDRLTLRMRLVSRSTDGIPADRNSRESCPSNGGSAVVFVSPATTLVAGDTNDEPDLFLRRYSPAK